MQIRQQTILELLVKEYIKTAEPVGSQVLVRKCKLDCSSATVRNEMAELEEIGYLSQPHTSAGRVPTDKGYRFFVDNLIEEKELTKKETEFLKLAVKRSNAQRQFAKDIAKAISQFSNNLGVCGFLDIDEFYSTGLSNLLRAPEFEDNSEIINSLGIFDYLDQEMKKVFAEMEKDVEVFIGRENKDRKFNDFSLIVSKCETKKDKKGMIGVLGPKRMDYAKNIALVDLMREFVEEF